MNTAPLKRYAPQARKDFIQAVTEQAAALGIAPDRILDMDVSGDVAIVGGRAFDTSVVRPRQELVKRVQLEGFEQVMEAMAYTWFNRFVALRYMELHDYLDHRWRVLSSRNGSPMPEILEHATDVDLPGLDRDKAVELRLAGDRDNELYAMLLIAQCNALARVMPFLFRKLDDATSLLIPANLLHSDSPLRKLVNEIDEDLWQQVEIIGWLYQFYISEKKDQVIGKVVKSEDIPAATQLFTPNWIVKYMVQNTLGHAWLATYPTSPLKRGMEFYIEPAEQDPEVQERLAAITPKSLNPEELTFMDPCCGSGHILAEAYDLFKAIYLERGYRQRDIPRLILEKNLHGLDIDDRAAQLARFTVLMKARADDHRILDPENPVQLNIMALQSSKGLDVEDIADRLTRLRYTIRMRKKQDAGAQQKRQEQGLLVPMTQPAKRSVMIPLDHASSEPVRIQLKAKKQPQEPDFQPEVTRDEVIALLTLFEDAKTFGSLLTIPEEIAETLKRFWSMWLKSTLKLANYDLETQSTIAQLEPFVRQASLLGMKYDFVVTNPPYMGKLTQELKAFSEREYPDSKHDLFAMFIEKCSEFTKFTSYASLVVMQVWMFLSSYRGLRSKILSQCSVLSLLHIGYNSFPSMNSKIAQAVSFVLKKVQAENFVGTYVDLNSFPQSSNKETCFRNLKKEQYHNIKQREFNSIPGLILGYWASPTLLKLFQEKPLKDDCYAGFGIKTGNNELFMRMWFEVCLAGVSFHAEQGKQLVEKWYPCASGGDYRKWYGNHNFVVNFEDGGAAIKEFAMINGNSYGFNGAKYYFRKSITWSKLTSAANSFRHTPTGFIFDGVGLSAFFDSEDQHLKAAIWLNSIVCQQLLKVIAPSLSLTSGDFLKLPFPEPSSINTANARAAIAIARQDWDSFETSWDFQQFPWITPPLKARTAAQSFANWQAHTTAQIQRMQELETENNRIFIDAYGLQDELSPEVPEEQITLARADRETDVQRLISYAIGCMMGRYSLDEPGLIYAHSGNEGFDPARYVTFAADEDGIVPLLPPDVEAGWFEDDASLRFLEFLKVVWTPQNSGENLDENLRFVADSLAPKRGEQPLETLRRYLTTRFYKEHHLKVYKNRPIYWLFSSGKERAFQCLVYLHRYTPGTLSRMRSLYVTPLQGKYNARLEYLRNEKEAATTAAAAKRLEKEEESLRRKHAELARFDDKLRHYADKRIALDLDDGVKVNYAKFGDLLAEVKKVTGKG